MAWKSPNCNYYDMWRRSEDEKLEYLHKASKYQTQKNNLEAELEAALAENQNLTSENAKLQQKNAELQQVAMKCTLQEEIKQLQQEREALHQELAQLKRDLASEHATRPWHLGNPYLIAYDSHA